MDVILEAVNVFKTEAKMQNRQIFGEFYYQRERNSKQEYEKMQRNLIQSDPSIMMGKPVIAGTRITVELILEKLSAGETVEQILKAHPRLTEKAIRAALAFASAS